MTLRACLRGFTLLSILSLFGPAFAAAQTAKEQPPAAAKDQPLLPEKTRLQGSSITISPDGKTMAALKSGEICIWDTATWKQLRIIEAPNGVHAIAFASNGTVACAGHQFITVVDAVTGKEASNLEDESIQKGGQFAISPNGQQVATTRFSFPENSTVAVWNARNGKKLHELKGFGVAFSSDSKRIATGDRTGQIWLWDAASGKELLQFKASKFTFGNRPRPLAFSFDGKTLSVGGNGGAEFFDLGKGSDRFQLSRGFAGGHHGAGTEDRILSIALSPDGAYAAATTWIKAGFGPDDTGFILFDMKTKTVLHSHQFDRAKKGWGNHSLAFTPDSKSVVAESSGAIVVWDLVGLVNAQALAKEAEIKAKARAAAPILAVPYSEGEKLLLEMERKLLDAKSLRISFEVALPNGDGKGKTFFSGVLETTNGNRCRTEVEVKDDQKAEAKEKWVEVSDGTKNRLVEGKTPYASDTLLPRAIVPKGYNDFLLQLVGRYGFYIAYMYTRNGDPTAEPIEIPKFVRLAPFGFKAVVKEKLDGRDALKVEFEDKEMGGNLVQKLKTNVWLDATTKLPLRRAFLNEKGTPLFVETYRSIEINPTLDPKRFVLPKVK